MRGHAQNERVLSPTKFPMHLDPVQRQQHSWDRGDGLGQRERKGREQTCWKWRHPSGMREQMLQRGTWSLGGDTHGIPEQTGLGGTLIFHHPRLLQARPARPGTLPGMGTQQVQVLLTAGTG